MWIGLYMDEWDGADWAKAKSISLVMGDGGVEYGQTWSFLRGSFLGGRGDNEMDTRFYGWG